MKRSITTTGTAELRIYNHFIAGSEVEPDQGRFVDKLNPASNEVDAMVALGSKGDVSRAVRAAQKAQTDGWHKLIGSDRRELLMKVADLMLEYHNALVHLDVSDIGKASSDVAADLTEAIATWRFYAGLADKVFGMAHPPAPDSFSYTLREPIGTVGIILPWTFPLLHFSRNVAAALACGNTVVVKPSELSPRSALKLAELCKIAGVPDGVVNVVCGDGPGTGAALARHPGINHVCFAGSTEVGKLVADMAAGHLATVTCELSGKNSTLVFEDANIPDAVDHVLQTSSRYQGQSNFACSRVLIDEKLKKPFVKQLLNKIKQIRIGVPADEDSMISCIVSPDFLERIECYVKIGKEEGANLVYGGKRPSNPKLGTGFYYMPTVFDNVTRDMRIAQEEILGPVLTIISFKDEDEALEIANGTRYGRVAWVFTNDLRRAHRTIRLLDAGSIIVNQVQHSDSGLPIAGHRESGKGQSFGVEAIASLTRIKNVTIGFDHRPERWIR